MTTAEPDGPVAVVTGAGSGLGRAISRALLDDGHRVALAGRRTAALAETADGHRTALVIATDVPRPGSIAYSAAKHAITGLTRSLALDGRPFGIACGQIDVGNAATEMTSGIAEGARQADGSVRPEPTFATCHVADAVRYMARLPPEANVPFLTLTATTMPFIGRG